jgi:hypothetical protein
MRTIYLVKGIEHELATASPSCGGHEEEIR